MLSLTFFGDTESKTGSCAKTRVQNLANTQELHYVMCCKVVFGTVPLRQSYREAERCT